MGWLGLMVDGRDEVMDQGVMAGAVGDFLASTVVKMSLEFKNGSYEPCIRVIHPFFIFLFGFAFHSFLDFKIC